MPSLPSSRQGFVISGSNTSYQNSSESDMIDGNANPNVSSSPTQNSLHRSSPSCPPDKSDSENKNFRTRVRVWYVWRSHYENIPVFSFYFLKYMCLYERKILFRRIRKLSCWSGAMLWESRRLPQGSHTTVRRLHIALSRWTVKKSSWATCLQIPLTWSLITTSQCSTVIFARINPPSKCVIQPLHLPVELRHEMVIFIHLRMSF